MVAYKPSQYQAYALATRTVAKTRQVVMLYDGAIRFLCQAEAAIEQNRIEERFKLLQRASEIIVGMQSSIDFEKGGEVAHTLHRFYTGMSMRIIAVNLKKQEGKQACADIIAELKQMREIWNHIDQTINKPVDNEVPPDSKPTGTADTGVSMSA